MKAEDLYNLDTYNYSLPKELIAQYPALKRDESRLLCYQKDKESITHHIFNELPQFLSPNDVLILNNTKVIPARFFAKTENNKEIEILLVNSISPDNLTWKVLAKPRKYLNNVGVLHATPISQINVIDSETIRFQSINDLESILNNIGIMPLPPYIKRVRDSIEGKNDFDRYQTVFAKEPGAVAAPTAALHFTDELLEKIKAKGVEILYITLHVGPGTFLPIRTENIREHKLLPEYFYIEQEVWNSILRAKKAGKRIVACGTTTVRALEYAVLIDKLSGLNSLYILPEHKFQVVDSLITNFHLPKTTLLVLVSAFVSWGNLKNVYQKAIEEKYRFYSYGDAMFVC